MKTKNVLALSLTLMLMITGTMAWAQGRGNGHGKGKGHQKHQTHNHDRNGNGRHYSHNRYSYHDHDRHHNHEAPRTVHVYHSRPVERTVVVHHHHHHRPARVRYVYYRDYDVYYDCDRKVYISFGGRNWSISTEIPVRMYYADRNALATVEVDYYDDDFAHHLDSHRPGGRICDHW